MQSASHRSAFVRIFAIPAIMAVIIAAGLASGVLGDGVWDVISWIALSVPIAVIVFNVFQRPRSV
jgi:hypothetical protein